LNRISNAKNLLWSPDELRNRAESLIDEVAADVYEKYQAKLRTNESLDFDDLLMVTVRLLETVPEVKDYYQRKFQYIHVDEYQDTNHAQYVLVRHLAGRFQNLCVVGDSDQSIYRFRGADLSNILNFERDYPQAKLIKLEQNYRSTKNILQAANYLIANNTLRKPKNLWTENEQGAPLYLFEAANEHEEAYYVAEMIRKGKEEGRRYQDFAVLYRMNAQSRVLEEVFLKANIPYQIVGGIKFYERKEIKDLLAYLRLVVNPHDDLSLQRIINIPRRGIGATTLDRISQYAREHGVSMFQALQEAEQIGLTKRSLQPIAEFVQMIQQFHALIEYLSAVELTEEILQRTGYREELKRENSLESASRLENIEEFLSVAKEFENRSDDKSLVAFLTDLALVSDVDQLDEATSDAVALMTLHSAKGLEFPCVFLVGMEEGIFPHSRSLDDDDEMEEERRLAYVGITRAEKELHLTYTKMRTIFGQTSIYPPSRFLSEIPPELIQPVGKTASAKAVSRPLLAKNTGGDWQVGDRVNHRKWGQGTIVKIEGSEDDLELTVAFPAPIGVKKLLASFAPIEKM
jgi:DNA helicase-2/ATP-dependent DNA helicase PcrA